MKSAIKKSTVREIKQSLGRYFAILAIVALGVGFFAGLKVTKAVMLKSAGEYLTEKQLYDYRLLSTLGFDEEDVLAFAGKEDVRTVAGAMSADILFVNEKGNVNVIKAHSLTEGVNGLEVVAGRLPMRADECVVDSGLYDEKAIGKKIILAEGNEQEDLEHFTYREYTITGIVQSSYYIQFERGNSALGSGRVSGFMYLLPEGFAMDYYTEVFVKFDDDYPLYAEEYEKYMKAKKPLWEDYCEEQGEARYLAVSKKAKEELQDAKKELAEKKAEAETKLADAKAELEDAEVKIADGEAQFADAEEKLADGERKLVSGEKELEDAEQTIIEKEKELADGKAKIEENEALLAEKRKEYEAGMEAYKAGKLQMDLKKIELDNALMQYNNAERMLASEQERLNAMAEVLPDDVLIKQQAALDEQKAELVKNGELLNNGYHQIHSAYYELNQAYNKLLEGGEQLADGEKQLAEAKKQLADGERQLAEARDALPEAKKTLEEKRKELEEAKQTLQEEKEELITAKADLADGWAEYNDGYAEFEEEIADAELKIADAEKDIVKLEKPDTYVLDRDTNIGYVLFKSDSGIVEGIANVFPVFFFLVAALVCITTMNRMVEEQRTQIGVLKALGYREGTIMGKYLFYSGSAATIGCVAGFMLGTYFFPLVIWLAYGLMYRMGDMLYVFDWKLALISLVCSLACSMGTTWLSCRHELKEVAAGLMRPKAPKAGKRVFLERIPFIWKRLKFLTKVSIRNVIRYKKRFFMMIIGISGCTALMVTGFGVRDSVINIANQQYREIQTFRLGITLQKGEQEAPEDTAKVLQKIEELGGTYTFAMESSMDMIVEEETKGVNLIVAANPAQMSDFISLHTNRDEPIPYPAAGEVVICEKLADTYGLEVGDRIVLRDDIMRELTVTISGICENYIYNYVYLSPQTYEDAFGDCAYKNIYVNLPENIDVHEAGASMMSNDNVAAATANEDMRLRISGMMGSMNYIVFVIAGCAAALAFIVLYNLNNINITERIREIATIKVLGFYKKETNSYVFRENMVLTAIGCAVGLFLGKLLHMYVMHEVVIDMISFDVHVKWYSYALSVLLTFVFNRIVNRMMSGKLDRINMAESLKSVD